MFASDQGELFGNKPEQIRPWFWTRIVGAQKDTWAGEKTLNSGSESHSTGKSKGNSESERITARDHQL